MILFTYFDLNIQNILNWKLTINYTSYEHIASQPNLAEIVALSTFGWYISISHSTKKIPIPKPHFIIIQCNVLLLDDMLFRRVNSWEYVFILRFVSFVESEHRDVANEKSTTRVNVKYDHSPRHDVARPREYLRHARSASCQLVRDKPAETRV